jgi:hypothetical protein
MARAWGPSSRVENARKRYWPLSALVVCAAVTLASGAALARDRVPYPRPRPAEIAKVQTVAPAKETEAPSQPEPHPSLACRERIGSDVAVIEPLPPISGPGECGAPDAVRLSAIISRAGKKIALNPPAVLRCAMAEALVDWTRNEADRVAHEAGSPLASIQTAASFECRGRNRVVGAKLSEHGHANAIDLRALVLANGKVLGLTDVNVGKDLRTQLQETACGHFTTVLGPGSDGYHEDHIHLDLIQRRGGYRMCQWAVREPGETPPPVAARKLPKFNPVQHADGAAAGIIPPPPYSLRGRVAESASCRGGQACPPEAAPRRERAPRRAVARRSGFPQAVFRW